MKEKILIVDDDHVLGTLLTDIITQEGYEAVHVPNGSKALEVVHKEPFQLILLDLIMPGMDGMDLLRHFMKSTPETMVIVISGHGTISKAVEATKLGAYDFMEKPLEKERVLLTVRNAMDKIRLIRTHSLSQEQSIKRYGMVGTSSSIRTIYSIIDRIAGFDTTVLITGETGTGKERIAHAIHQNSRRAGGPFVQVNCAAIPEELVESELFGHLRGSFTGAVKDKDGKFQQADKGTLFLDEVADLSPKAQAKILRAIEDGHVSRVGSSDHEVVNVRLISATNKDLKVLVTKKQFREDLYHRLDVIPIAVPLLNDRTEDILPLIDHFMNNFCNSHQLSIKRLLPDAEGVLLAYKWPGNVRELQHFVEKLMLLVEDTSIPGSIVSHLLDLASLAPETLDASTLQKAQSSFEKSYIMNALQTNNWNISRTAKQLGINRTHLYRKIKKHNIEAPGTVA